MWFCVHPENGTCFAGNTPEHAWGQMEENYNVGPEDCEFYFVQDGPLCFANKLVQIHKED